MKYRAYVEVIKTFYHDVDALDMEAAENMVEEFVKEEIENGSYGKTMEAKVEIVPQGKETANSFTLYFN